MTFAARLLKGQWVTLPMTYRPALTLPSATPIFSVVADSSGCLQNLSANTLNASVKCGASHWKRFQRLRALLRASWPPWKANGGSCCQAGYSIAALYVRWRVIWDWMKTVWWRNMRWRREGGL